MASSCPVAYEHPGGGRPSLQFDRHGVDGQAWHEIARAWVRRFDAARAPAVQHGTHGRPRHVPASIGTPIRAGISPISPPNPTYSISSMNHTHLRKPTNMTSAGKVSTGPTLWIIVASHRSRPIGDLLLRRLREGPGRDLASCRARSRSDQGTATVLRRCAPGRVIRQHCVEAISEPLRR